MRYGHRQSSRGVTVEIGDDGWVVRGPVDAITIIRTTVQKVAPVLAPTLELHEVSSDALKGDRDVSRNMRFVCLVAHVAGFRVGVRDVRSGSDHSGERLYLPNRNVLEQWTRTRDALNTLLSDRDARSLFSSVEI